MDKIDNVPLVANGHWDAIRDAEIFGTTDELKLLLQVERLENLALTMENEKLSDSRFSGVVWAFVVGVAVGEAFMMVLR